MAENYKNLHVRFGTAAEKSKDDVVAELCEDVILSCKSSLCIDCEHNGIDYPNCMGVHFAAHLIANGVGLTKEMAAEIKRLHLQLETMTKDRDYYRDAYHHLLKERNGGAGE